MKKHIILLLMLFGLKCYSQENHVEVSRIESEIMSILSKFDSDRSNAKQSFAATVLISNDKKSAAPSVAISDNVDTVTSNLLKKYILENLNMNRLFSLVSSSNAYNVDIIIPIYINVEYRGKKEEFRIPDLAKMYGFHGKMYRGSSYIMNPVGIFVVTEF